MKILSTLSSFFSKKTNNSSANEFENFDKQNKIVRQKIYNEISVFTFRDFEDLKSNESYDQFEIGELHVPSGKIVCADPLRRGFGFPQNWEVPIGKYLVHIYIGTDDDFEGRIAYAEITFSNEEVESWELSLIDESLLTDDFEKQLNGMYIVEAGLSSFSDFETWKKHDKYFSEYQEKDEKANFYTDILEPLFQLNDGIPKSSRGEDWVNYKMDNENIIMFGSGLGDGIYSRYVGFDSNRNPVKLVTDFIALYELED